MQGMIIVLYTWDQREHGMLLWSDGEFIVYYLFFSFYRTPFHVDVFRSVYSCYVILRS